MKNMWLISKQAFGVSLDLSCTAGSTPLIVSENLFIYQKIMFTNDDFPTIIDDYESLLNWMEHGLQQLLKLPLNSIKARYTHKCANEYNSMITSVLSL